MKILLILFLLFCSYTYSHEICTRDSDQVMIKFCMGLHNSPTKNKLAQSMKVRACEEFFRVYNNNITKTNIVGGK